MRRAIFDFGFRILDWVGELPPARGIRLRNPQSKIENPKSQIPRPASVLLLVLVVVAILALGTNTYLELMQTEHRAVRRHGRAMQAKLLAESGVEYLKIVLTRTPAQLVALGGLTSNPTAMQFQMADNQADVFSRGRFTILCPAQINGIYSGVRYGLENESAKLNLNVLLADGADSEARNRLMALPGMTPDVADAIIDWLDSDSAPREFGAENEYYGTLNPPYTPRNGPISGLDELLMVRGVTPELLYGLDQNRNYQVDAGELPRGALAQISNAEGEMNRGWSAYLTVDSVELMGGANMMSATSGAGGSTSGSNSSSSSGGGTASAGTVVAGQVVDLNSGDLQTLYKTLQSALGDEQAKFIILYRQYGQPSQGGQGGPGQPGGGAAGGPGGGGAAGQPGQQQGLRGAGNSRGQPGGTTVSASSITLNMQQPAATQITSLLDLVGVSVQVPQTPPGGPNGGGNSGNGGSSGGGSGNGGSGNGGAGNNGGGNQGGGGGGNPGGNPGGGPGGNGQNGENQPPPQTVLSPWQDNQGGYRELLKLADVGSVVNQGRIAGRVNINAASRPVLRSIPYLPVAAVEQILARRELEPNLQLSEQRHALWLLTTGLVQLAQMRQIERFITTRGDAYSGQSVGFFEGDPTPVRGEFILDKSVGAPRLRLWRDMTALGSGFSPQLLGVPAEQPR